MGKQLCDVLDDLQEKLQEAEEMLEWIKKDISTVVKTLIDLSQDVPYHIVIDYEELERKG